MRKKKNTVFFVFVAFLLCISILFFWKNPENPRIILADYLANKGNLYFTGNNYNIEKAERYFKYSLYFDPQVTLAHYQLARIYFTQNDFSNAKKEIDLELKNHPENKRSFYVRGLIDGYSKNYAEAENDFQQFIAFAPDEWPGYMDLSWVYINDQKFQEALDIDNKGLAEFPNQVWLLSNKGLALYKLKNYQDAEGVLERAKELAKNLTPDDWKTAYPGNDPSGAVNGVLDIRGAISYNLALVYKNLNKSDKYIAEVDYYQSLFPPGDTRINKIYDSL